MITWKQKLGKEECPYLHRWIIDFKLFSIRIHHWFFGDDPRHFHDHPWSFLGMVLWGCYYDVTEKGEEYMWPGKIFYRQATHKHTVKTDGCWTLIFTGPEVREWGFWIVNKSKTKEIWFKAKRYFIKYGHHPCNKG